MKIKILGIGSPFGADRIGWLAAEALERSDLRERFSQHEISIETCDRPGAGLIEEMRGGDLVILIDAMRAGAAPGTVWRVGLDEIEKENVFLSSHGFGVAEALALGGALDTLPPRVIVYGIEVPVVRASDDSEGLDVEVLRFDLAALISKEVEYKFWGGRRAEFGE